MTKTHSPRKPNAALAWRIFFYLLGLLVLALGISMNTKAGLGVSPLISVSYSAADILGRSFANMTLLLYSAYVVVEMILHLLHSKGLACRGNPPKRKLSMALLLDALQFPLSLVFTRFLNIFDIVIPNLASDQVVGFWSTLPGRVLFLLAAICLTGIGAAFSLNMRIIPNPGDGIVQALSDSTGASVGLTKNFMDLGSVALTCVVSLACTRNLIGIGLGTVLCVIGVGRVIAVFNHLCRTKTLTLAGLDPFPKLSVEKGAAAS